MPEHTSNVDWPSEYNKDNNSAAPRAAGTVVNKPMNGFRSALEQMRADLKTDLFDAVYFHSAEGANNSDSSAAA